MSAVLPSIVLVARLTTSESVVLAMRADGFSRVEIARALHRSVRTIDAHARSAGLKLGTCNPWLLARFALASGLISLHRCRRSPGWITVYGSAPPARVGPEKPVGRRPTRTPGRPKPGFRMAV